MKNENEYFKNLKPIPEKLKKYGFVFEDDVFKLNKPIHGGTLSLKMTIDKENITTSIFDDSFGDEFIGALSLIRDEYSEIMEDLRKNCFASKAFGSTQPERISKMICKKYSILPDLPFEESDIVVYRIKSSDKWFGLTMSIDYSKIEEGSGMVTILNLKTANGNASLLGIKGIYPAYHMNKKLWISIPLDETMNDEDVMKYVDDSYHAVADKKGKKKKQ